MCRCIIHLYVIHYIVCDKYFVLFFFFVKTFIEIYLYFVLLLTVFIDNV